MYNQLLTLDLSPAERTAYETLITHGAMAPPQLAKAANLTRVNGYAALRGLAQKGLAKEKDINKKRVYSPEPPTKLQELARQKADQARTGMESIEAIIPSLMNQYALVSEQPGISHYEGLEGIKQVYEDTLKAPHPEEILVLRSVYDYQLIDDYILKYIDKRAKSGIRSRLIGHYFVGHLDDKKLLRQRRYYSRKEFSLPTEISIYGDRVSLISLRKDLIATVIQSKDVAQTFKVIFELLWDGAKEYS
jgi:sugar-specific transcriptional regulator TrmB